MRKVRLGAAITLWALLWIPGLWAASEIVLWHAELGQWWMLLLGPFAPLLSMGMSIGEFFDGYTAPAMCWLWVMLAVVVSPLGMKIAGANGAPPTE